MYILLAMSHIKNCSPVWHATTDLATEQWLIPSQREKGDNPKLPHQLLHPALHLGYLEVSPPSLVLS